MVYNRNKKEKEITVSIDQVRDHGNDPYFVNKARQSKAFLDKNGFPTELLRERKARMGV